VTQAPGRITAWLQGGTTVEILILVIALVALDIAALLYGADSRFGVNRYPQMLGIPR
jgi:hypothetical protein